jgi:predicted Zn-dependent peptidase
MYRKDALKNGLRVITSNMPHMESVSIGVWIGVGGRYESRKHCGISHLIEHMLFKGTASRTAVMLKEAIEGVGGTFNAFTGQENTCYFVKLPAGYLELGLDILSDMVLNPVLDRRELEKEKQVICEEIKMYMDQPAQYVFDILAETMWPYNPLGYPITGYLDTVTNLKKEHLVEFQKRYYQPANIIIVVTGKGSLRKKSLSFANNIFSMPSGQRTFPFEELKGIHKGARVTLLQKNTEQTHMILGFHSVNRTHKLRFAALLLHTILGGNMSSRLFERLREQKALCYEIASSVKKYKETGAFIIHAGVDNNMLFEALREITGELRNIKKNFVTPDELHRAKEYCRGQFLLALEDTASRMVWLGEKIILEGKAPSVKALFRNIEKVTIEDVKRTANIVFDTRNLNFATIGPAGTKARSDLKKILNP